MRINRALAQKPHPITSLNWGTLGEVPVCLYSSFGLWWVKSDVFLVCRLAYSCGKSTRFLKMGVIQKMGALWSSFSQSTHLTEGPGCDWCSAGSLLGEQTLKEQGHMELQAVTGLRTSQVLSWEGWGLPSFTSFRWGHVSGKASVRKWHFSWDPKEGEGLAGEGEGTLWQWERVSGGRKLWQVRGIEISQCGWSVGTLGGQEAKVKARLGRALWTC